MRRGSDQINSKEIFMRIRPMLWLAVLLAFGAPGASPVSAEEAAQTRINLEAETRIYKSGDKYVVAFYRADGSEIIGLLEPPKSFTQVKIKAPTLADLKDWRVVTSIDVAAKNAGGKMDAAFGKPGNAKLTRKRRLELIEKSRSTAVKL